MLWRRNDILIVVARLRQDMRQTPPSPLPLNSMRPLAAPAPLLHCHAVPRARSRAQAARAAAGAGPYEVLGLPRSASKAEVKAAFRKQALKVHPDVSDDPDAGPKFAALSLAYTAILEAGSEPVDPADREPIDSWPEFKRTAKTPTRRGAARGAAAGRREAGAGEAGGSGELSPQVGDLVEYPLPASDTRTENGRTAGLALLLSRNCDRGDWKKLPPEMLPLCELEPLRLDDGGDGTVWVTDDLGVPVFAMSTVLRVVSPARVTYNVPRDYWTVQGSLSPGCESPPGFEEVIL